MVAWHGLVIALDKGFDCGLFFIGEVIRPYGGANLILFAVNDGLVDIR